MSKNAADNRADQLNHNNDAYHQSRGLDERPDDWEDQEHDYDNDNRSNQMNPNNEAYQRSRS